MSIATAFLYYFLYLVNVYTDNYNFLGVSSCFYRILKLFSIH